MSHDGTYKHSAEKQHGVLTKNLLDPGHKVDPLTAFKVLYRPKCAPDQTLQKHLSFIHVYVLRYKW